MTLPMFLLLFVICVNIVVGQEKNVFTSSKKRRRKYTRHGMEKKLQNRFENLLKREAF